MPLEVWLVATVAAVVFGMSKTGVPSLGGFGMAVLATVVDPVLAAGLALPVLICGDLVALSQYGRSADRRTLLALLPSVVVGLAAGWLLVDLVDATTAGRVIGALLLVAAGWELWRRHVARRARRAPVTSAVAGGQEGATGAGAVATRWALGAGAGLSTMVANAGGPMMSLYLIRARLTTATFLGTNAWFFFAVNLVKVPFSVGLGLITPASLRDDLLLLPGLVLGAVVGRLVVRRLSLDRFTLVVLVATVLAGAWMVVR